MKDSQSHVAYFHTEFKTTDNPKDSTDHPSPNHFMGKHTPCNPDQVYFDQCNC